MECENENKTVLKDRWMPLKARWGEFLTVICDPFVVIFLVITIALGFALVLQTNRIIVAILTLLLAFSSGILGRILAERWEDITGQKIAVVRGETAIRSLKLLLGSAVALEERVSEYLSCLCIAEKEKKELSYQIMRTHLEEVANRCVLLQKGILSSIESWTDITPEGDITSQIEVLGDLRSKVADLNQEVNALGDELLETKGKSEAEIKALKAEKRQKEKELVELRNTLSGQTIRYGFPLTSSSFLPSNEPSLIASSWYHNLNPGTKFDIPIVTYPACASCGQIHVAPPGSSKFDKLCPDSLGTMTPDKKP